MNFLHYTLITLALIIIVITMLQAKGSGLSIVPGSNDFGKFERRGPEKILHQVTIILVIAFVGLSMISYFVS
jgi:protein translocase SecG subunit